VPGRAGEVTGITLDDIDWRAGVLLVTGKADQAGTLPLPADVGDTLAGYVRHGRARTSSRHLFITVRAPFTKLALNTSICGIVERAGPAGRHPAVRAAPAASRGGLRPAGRRCPAHRDRAVAAPSLTHAYHPVLSAIDNQR
jgi:integrase